MITLSFKKRFPVSVKVLFDWHAMPGAFLRLNPPFEPVKLVSHTGGIKDGALVTIKIPLIGSIGIPWTLTHTGYVDGEKFEDTQVKGPFASWHHRHLFHSINTNESELYDEVTFSLPFSFISEPLFGWIFKKKLTKLFHFRHIATQVDLEVIEKYRSAFSRPQKFLISGASGFVGQSLASLLLTAGHTVLILSRGDKDSLPDEVICVPWNPYRKEIELDAIEGVDHVIHLSGESVAQRWSAAAKKRILDSRIITTEFLVACVQQLQNPPQSFICASGIGFYGAHSYGSADEQTLQGEGFLADIVCKWERALAPLEGSPIRLCKARFGIILSPDGGALKKLILPFIVGFGGPIGKGLRFMSCIAKSDVAYGLYHLTATPKARGVFNFCVPKPVTNLEFSKTLANVLKRPCLFFVPPIFLKLFFGEMASETILSSQEVYPNALLKSGFTFKFPTVESILRFVTGN